jgi:hypothetical protein
MNTDTGKVYEGEAAINAAKKRGEPLADLPYKPDPYCKLCRGAGTVRSWGTPNKYGACGECYPDHPQKARSFTAYLVSLQSFEGRQMKKRKQ